MSTTEALAHSDEPHLVPAAVEVVIPVFNEEVDLEPNVRLLRRYLDTRFPLATVVTIADNASTDGTWVIAQRLSQSLPGVRAVHLDEKGRGRAIKQVWQESDALVVAYMDVDLSTGLDALLPLVAPLLSGHAEIAVGTRLASGARVERGRKRAFISRCYNLILHASLASSFSDAQCGFKAVRTDVAKSVLPLVEDNGWFFDTEMLMIADYSGLRIHEVAVDWTDDPDSRVDIVHTAVDDLLGVLRLMRKGTRRRRRVAFSGYRPSPVSALTSQTADGAVR
jgi:glycosyltransferase involved in cell wall biosynthesis